MLLLVGLIIIFYYHKRMIINLPNGKSIEVSLEVYLRMTDEDYEYLVSANWGDDLNNPFVSSVLLNGESKRNYDYEDELEENSEEYIDPDSLDKLQDLDIEPDDE